ncbi:FAD/NAD(P)-binding domain-containing protein [Wolfiporia cocos MD-104 SS10]|uniref:FAD/NAD(P)-binding domain-containing protein n=1 Tax=Wolfiporia cocos (strain MD-104) TaxID=742152 RepID=A0A2H3JC27_WOLCO|nr:FAD/NAD(P)-binding domain-containing protein [Wolfiporia cocos MD-104 SS10]
MFDCIVVGSGHAGSCAALSAVEAGCRRVLIVEKAPREWAGGNGFFTAGAHRTVHGGLHDFLPIVRNAPPEVVSTIDMEPYTAEQFTADIMRLGDNRADPAIVRAVVDGSRDAVGWLADQVGVPFTFSFNRQAYLVDGRQKFWGGLVLSVDDGGRGLIAAHQRALEQAGVETWFETPAVELLTEDGAVSGVVVLRSGESVRLRSRAVVLACGGFEASAELRAEHLGPEWLKAKVRGTPYNTGDGLSLARGAGAALAGDFAHCHATCWDAHAPDAHGDRVLLNQLTKSGYPLGVLANAHGVRFADEGADFRNYTYARLGRAVLRQPGAFAFQLFDPRAARWLRAEEYADAVVAATRAESLSALADKLVAHGLADRDALLATLHGYNGAVRAARAEHPERAWDPAVKDGLSTESARAGCDPPKSNWALPLEEPPFVAVKVACGITFTFGGLAIDPRTAGVLAERTATPIRGLFCTGELVGGLFFGNYPGGSGLTAGAVFGRMAGREAAKLAA